MKKPSSYIFDEFFLSGLEPSISPFLTDNSRKWCKNLGLKNALFSLFLLILSYVFSPINAYISFFLLTIIFFLMGVPAILNTLENLKRLNININVLMTVAAFVSLIIQRPQEGALLLVLFGISNALESTLSYKTKSAIHSLNKLSPTKVFFLEKDGSIHEKSIKEIAVGDHLFIKAGEIIPLDGIVFEGSSFVHLKHLTGESLPVSKKKGDIIHAGSRNLEGTLTIKVTKTSALSTLSQIIKLIEKAQKTKPKMQKIFDTFGKKYASTIISLSLFFALFLPLFFSISFLGMKGSIYRSLAFLIAASPCALIIATPTAYLSAISSCAKKGIILKGGAVVDALYKCKMIAFDKTGTLTKADLEFLGIDTIEKTSLSQTTVLQIAASLEKGSSHPIAQAITSHAKGKNIKNLEIHDFQSISGYGVSGKVFLDKTYQKAFIGLSKYIEKELSFKQSQELEKQKKKALEKGELLTILWVKKELFLFKFSDTLRKNIKHTIQTLESKNHLTSIMLTGDNKNIADAVAKKIEIKTVYSELKPKDKLELISSFARKTHLAMVGDGINDAPALARATVGISLGKIGSATAIDASDVILLNDNISTLPWLFHKAKKTRKIIKENLILSLMVIIFASLPALLGWIPLYLAVILHEGGTLLVGCNSLRILRN